MSAMTACSASARGSRPPGHVASPALPTATAPSTEAGTGAELTVAVCAQIGMTVLWIIAGPGPGPVKSSNSSRTAVVTAQAHQRGPQGKVGHAAEGGVRAVTPERVVPGVAVELFV